MFFKFFFIFYFNIYLCNICLNTVWNFLTILKTIFIIFLWCTNERKIKINENKSHKEKDKEN